MLIPQGVALAPLLFWEWIMSQHVWVFDMERCRAFLQAHPALPGADPLRAPSLDHLAVMALLRGKLDRGEPPGNPRALKSATVESYGAARLCEDPAGALGALGLDGEEPEGLVDVVRDYGERLVKGYGGSFAGVVASAKGHLGGRTGLIRRCEVFLGFQGDDSHRIHRLVMGLSVRGMLDPPDKEHLSFPLNPRLLRNALEAGVLKKNPVGKPSRDDSSADFLSFFEAARLAVILDP